MKAFRLSALSAATFLVLSGTAYAAPVGTAAGTAVNNIATLSYTVGGVTQSDLKSCVTTACTSTTGTNTSFNVDLKVNLDVASTDTTFVPIVSSGTAVLAFSVTNNSNATLAFDLTAADKAAGAYTGVFAGSNTVSATDNTALTSCSTYSDAAATTPLSTIASLASGSSQTVYVKCTAPDLATAPLGNIGVVSLTAAAKTTAGDGSTDLTSATTATIGGTSVGVVRADAAGDGGDLANDGKSSDLGAFRIETANLTVLKATSAYCDPVNGSTSPKAIPGAIVNYTITITNDNTTAPATASMVKNALLKTLSDPLVNTLDLLTTYAGTGAQTASTCSTAAAAITGTGTLTNAATLAVTAGSTGSVHRTTAAAAPIDVALTQSGTAGYDDVVTISQTTFATALPSGTGYAAGELPPGDTVVVKFQAVIR